MSKLAVNFFRDFVADLGALLHVRSFSQNRPTGVSASSQAARSGTPMFLINLVSFITFAVFAFSLNSKNLFLWRDGTYMEVLTQQQLVWGDMGLGFTANIFHGLGNIWFPYNLPLIPGYFLSTLFNSSGEVYPVLAYVVFSVELFAAVYLLGASLRLAPVVSVLAAWLLPLAVMPVISADRVYPVMGIIPNLATLIALSVVILVLFWRIGRSSLSVSIACLAGIALVVLYMILSQPLLMVLPAPVLVIFGISLLIAAESRREVLLKLGAAAILVIGLLVSGAAAFQYGLYKYTAVLYFTSELLKNLPGLYNASILFQSEVHSLWGAALFLAGLLGAVVTLFIGARIARALAIATLLTMGLIVTFGVLCAKYDFWRGPAAVYFEFFLWPFYAVFAAIAIAAVVALLANILRQIIRWMVSRQFNPAGVARAAAYTLAALPWLIFAYIPPVASAPKIAFAYPPSPTPITALLKQQIGLQPGGTYRGRVASFTGQNLPGRVSWADLAAFDYLSSVTQFNNDHRMEGLWYFDIPTLSEYNQFITPPFYLITRTFLARPGDQQIRTVMTLRNVDPRILRMIGVRYLITDAPITTGATLRVPLPNGEGTIFYLYELDGVNIGQFSPTRSIPAGDAHAMMTALAQADFNPTESVIVETPLPEKLVPLSAGEIRVEPGQLRLSAGSAGSSVMLLPFEYSHCLQLKAEGASTAPTLFRANLLQAGILFTGKLDATLRFSFGPFNNAGCRLEDISDMKRLNIAAEAKPAP